MTDVLDNDTSNIVDLNRKKMCKLFRDTFEVKVGTNFTTLVLPGLVE